MPPACAAYVRAPGGYRDHRFVCVISDHGSGLEDPLTGHPPAHPGHAGGARVWVARQMTPRLELLSPSRGLSVRLWI